MAKMQIRNAGWERLINWRDATDINTDINEQWSSMKNAGVSAESMPLEV